MQAASTTDLDTHSTARHAARRGFRVWLAALWLLPAAAAAYDLGSQYDPKADFDGYRTYAWTTVAKKPDDTPLAAGGPLDRTIRTAVERRLERRGYRPAGEGETDFRIAYDGALVPTTHIEGNRLDLFDGVDLVVDGPISTYPEATLILIVFDGRTGKPVWSAWTTEKIRNPDDPGAQVEEAVKKLLGRFPPPPKHP